MNCFPCCASQKSKKSFSKREHGSTTPQETIPAKTPDMKKQKPDEENQVDTENVKSKNFTFRELATATKNFKQECLLSEGGFGRVYRGIIPTTGQVVAVKQLDRHGTQCNDFVAEVATLSLLHHENLVNLIGYCADGDQRLLVYEFIHGCTLEDRLLENKADEPPLDWFNRMKIAAGASQGLQYLHESANPPVIYRDLKASNIFLDNDLNARLLDFGMAKLTGGDKMNHAPPRVMGTYGYCAPEYVRGGQLTLKSDVYSFGVILLELITGRRAIDTTRPNEEQNLVSWAQPLFRDPKRYPDMADPHLNKHFPEKDLNQAVAIAAMCLQEESEARPLISDVVTALSFLSTVPTEVIRPSLPPATSVSKARGASGSETEADKESQPRQVFSSKSSRKSSSRSRNGTLGSDSGDGSISSSSKSSRKSHGNLSQKSSKKSSAEDSRKKSSKKSSTKDLSQKSSRKSSSHKSSGKSSARILSHKSSMVSDDGSISCGSSRASLSQYSSSVASEDEDVHSDLNSSRRTDEESIRLSQASSMGSDEGSVYSR